MRPKSLLSRLQVPLCGLAVVLGVALVVTLFTAPRGSALPVQVSGLSVDHGLVAGGEQVLVTGKGFTSHGEVQAVTFGDVEGTEVFVVDDTLLVAEIPATANGQGTVDVAVKCRFSPEECAALQDAFTYLGTPTICEISAATCDIESGVCDIQPGGTVMIRGTGFHPRLTESVTFNGVESSDVRVEDCCTLIAVIPDLDPGPAVVEVTTQGYGTASASLTLDATPVSEGAVAGWSSGQ